MSFATFVQNLLGLQAAKPVAPPNMSPMLEKASTLEHFVTAFAHIKGNPDQALFLQHFRDATKKCTFAILQQTVLPDRQTGNAQMMRDEMVEATLKNGSREVAYLAYSHELYVQDGQTASAKPDRDFGRNIVAVTLRHQNSKGQTVDETLTYITHTQANGRKRTELTLEAVK